MTPFSLRDLLDATSTGGTLRVSICEDAVKRVCLLCEAAFDQDDAGFAALRAHEFEHGIASLFRWSEVEGKRLRIVVVQSSTGVGDSPLTDVYGVDDANGTVYHLTQKFRYSHDDKDTGSWKWKITSPLKHSIGPNATRFALASPSSG